MKNRRKALLFIAGLLCAAAHAATIQLDGDIAVRTAGWFDLAGESGVNNVHHQSGFQLLDKQYRGSWN
ncbi:hypothetical protein P4B35_01775 [Pontiellaceae bacterium B12227]|nr:hypothetical protein [Pontiellaceae bacterium B12227]